MTISTFVISLDFELFWGVGDKQTIAGYGRNVLGEWEAVPQLLALFNRHGIRATWATVGMIMCRDYQHWCDMRPPVLPTYARREASTYTMDELAREHPRLFFARPLVERIMETDGQELGTHTYSHFYCREEGVTPEQFAADLACAGALADGMGVRCRSLVLPRNQIVDSFLSVLPEAGIRVYRGNARHWLYENGDAVPGGVAGRAMRFLDACLPLSGSCVVREQRQGALVNLPASLFFYPWSAPQRALVARRLQRLKRGMEAAARSGGVFHLWWHPHNFGVDLAHNLAMLGEVLRHFHVLAERYGMQSRCMGDFAMDPPGRQLGAPPEASPLHAMAGAYCMKRGAP